MCRICNIEKLRETVDTISKKNISTSETVVSLKQESEELQWSLRDKMSENKRMEAEITLLLSDKERICRERDSLQDKVSNYHVTFYMILMHVELQLESEISESNRLRISLRGEEESNQSKIAMLEQQYQSEISRLTAQVSLTICLQTALNSLVRRCRRPPDLQKKLMYCEWRSKRSRLKLLLNARKATKRL
jgi:chromosome segregation ATPase